MRRAVCLGLVLLAACSLPGLRRGIELEPGRAVDVAFDASTDEGRLFRVAVGARATALFVTTEGANVDVELYARRGAPPDPWAGLWDAVAASAWLDEELLIEASDALSAGTWYVLVCPAVSVLPDPRASEVRLSLRADVVEPPVHELVLDAPNDLVLERSQGLRAVLRIDPAQARHGLRLEAACELADVDLMLGWAGDARVYRDLYAAARTTHAFERIDLLPGDLDRGPAYLHVFAYPSLERWDQLPVRVLAAGPERPDLGLAPAPRVPAPPADPLERAVAATMSLFGPLGGGSGVVVSPDGLVLTNAHVVEGAGDLEGGLPAVHGGFTLDPAVPAAPTVGLRIVDVRRDLDLALLRIDSRVDGGPLPSDLVLPCVELAPGRAPLGAPVSIVGYPTTGGSGSIVTVTLTRGIVAGYAAEAEGLVYKTDAAVHSGVSGGACIDLEGRLLGLPTASIADANEAGGLGYVLPIDLVPDAWRAQMGR